MKVQLLKTDDQSGRINNYEHVFVTGYTELEYPDNSINEIVVKEVLGLISRDKIIDFISGLCKKIRHGGRVIVNDVDLRSLCLYYQNEDIDTNHFNEKVHGSYLYDVEEIVDILSRLQINVDLYSVKGYNFEIIANRK